jgi:hypothetical protein
MNTLTLQQALASGGTIQLPPGETVIEPTAATGNPDRLSDIHLRAPSVIIGDSDGTSRLRMVGGLGRGARSLFDVIAGSLTLRGVHLDGSDRENISEQVHLVNVAAGASLTVEDCIFTLPALSAPGSGGDGIKVSGGIGVTVSRSKFDRCDRSGISIHGGRDIAISDCSFEGTGDADIDIEPPSADIVSNVRIERIRVSRTRPGDSVQLTRCANVTVDDADLGGGRLVAISASMLSVRNVTAGEVIVRRGCSVMMSQLTAPAVRVFGDGTGIPRGVILDRVTTALVEVESAEGVYTLRSDVGSIVYRAVLCPTFGGHVGTTISGRVYRQPRDKGLPWILE